MGYICTRCGGTNVACEAIVNPNTGKIIDYFDGSFMHAICSNCENEVIISNIEEVKHEIDLRFHEFVERTGKEPEYVECQIVRKETGDEQRKTIKLSLSINDDDQNDWFRIDREIFMQPENRNKIFILGTRKTGCDLIILGGTNCNEGSMDWLFGSLGNENFYVCQPLSFQKSSQEIEKVNPLYAFKLATAYFRGQGMVPVFEDCHCRLVKL